jgi:hypothetical protein
MSRFIWILPALVFVWELAEFVSQFTFFLTVQHFPHWLTFELMIGTIAYSLGTIKAYRKTQ